VNFVYAFANVHIGAILTENGCIGETGAGGLGGGHWFVLGFCFFAL